jgi:hypothetical protein
MDQNVSVWGKPAVLFWSGPTVLSSSNTEPGQPWVMISGIAFG